MTDRELSLLAPGAVVYDPKRKRHGIVLEPDEAQSDWLKVFWFGQTIASDVPFFIARRFIEVTFGMRTPVC